MISKYGTNTVRKYLMGAAAALALTFILAPPGILRSSVSLVIASSAALVLNFFRDPDRKVPQGNNLVVSPADGRVILIKETFEEEYLRGESVQVSIFMSPLNVHVNRFPISGTVSHFKHFPGEYLLAFDDKASTRNERTHIGVDDHGYRVLFKQIAGNVARRIVADISVGQIARIGERFGMIKFGSRVDVLIPKHSQVSVKLKDRVTAGETILASYDSPHD